MDKPLIEVAWREIDELHRFFERWYRGTETGDMGRVAHALASDFELLAPTGDLISRDQLLDELAAGRGAYPALTITLEHLGTRSARNGVVAVEYIEQHAEHASLDRRHCCALLRRGVPPFRRMEVVAIYERRELTLR